MDHSHHAMDHSGHDMDMGHNMPADRCSMNMLFTWDTTNLCIVFRGWHVRSTAGLIFSLLAVVAIGVGFEALRAGIRRYEIATTKRLDNIPSDTNTETTPLAWATGHSRTQANQTAHIIKSLLYAFQTFYAFMLMLVFMTYNGWIMVAVTVGAFAGYLLFGNKTSAVRETQCH